MKDPRERIAWGEFKLKTGIRADCYIFKEMGEPKFFKSESHRFPTVYYFENGLGVTWKFKYMKSCNETWFSKMDLTKDEPCWTEWSTFKVWGEKKGGQNETAGSGIYQQRGS